MNVKLIKSAVYDLKSENCANIPFNYFKSLCRLNTPLEFVSEMDNLPNVEIFTSMAEFGIKDDSELEKYDTDKGVLVMSNGNFCVFLKDDGTTDTEENTGE